MKSDLTHEKLGANFYDDALIGSFSICVPLAFLTSVASKLRRENVARLDGFKEDERNRKRTVEWSRCQEKLSKHVDCLPVAVKVTGLVGLSQGRERLELHRLHKRIRDIFADLFSPMSQFEFPRQ
eukprot:COSAG02_NODE_33062_length_506_cov_0.744472_1_plen_124_part_10